MTVGCQPLVERTTAQPNARDHRSARLRLVGWRGKGLIASEERGPHLPLRQMLDHGESEARLPTVSVIMAALNAELYLAEAIESVLGQFLQRPWELLVVDDGSSDATLEIAKAYARRFPRSIRVLRHAGGANRGASASRNLALNEARGEFLAFLDADDVWLPGMLARQVATLRSRPAVAMVYANAERWWDFDLPFDPAVGPLGENTLPPLVPTGARAGLIPPPRLLDWFRADETMAPCTCTVVVRAATARRVGGFVDEFRGLFDDQAFYAKIALEHQVWVNLECVARYRRHSGSTCVQAWEDEERTARERERFHNWLRRYRRALRPLVLCPDQAHDVDTVRHLPL